jgi:hypothetical protein
MYPKIKKKKKEIGVGHGGCDPTLSFIIVIF